MLMSIINCCFPLHSSNRELFLYMLNALEQHDASLDAHAEIYSISNTVVVITELVFSAFHNSTLSCKKYATQPPPITFDSSCPILVIFGTVITQ